MVLGDKEYCCEDCEQCFIGSDICPDCGGFLVDDMGTRAEDDCEEDL